jgi:hypothetical protein
MFANEKMAKLLAWADSYWTLPTIRGMNFDRGARNSARI